MNDEMKYTTVRKLSSNEEGLLEIVTDKFHEKQSAHIEEWLKHIRTSHTTFLADVVDCLDVLKGENATPELVIRIKSRNGLPYEITKQWIVKKENYNKR